MLVSCGGTIHAKSLGQATITQINNDVRFKPAASDERAAKTKDIVKGADLLRTGQKSQVELVQCPLSPLKYNRPI
jgi:hypothetical protein